MLNFKISKSQAFEGQFMKTFLLKLDEVKVFLDISAFWPKDDLGDPRTVNSVYEEVRGTENEVGRNTLRLALDGRLDRGHFVNAVKLARLAASWSKKELSVMDLLVIEENEASS